MNVRLLEENDHKPPPPGLRWRELMQQQQAAKRHSGEGPSSTSSSPSPSRQLLDKSYESLTRVAVEDFLLRESAVQRWIEECLGTPLRSSQPALYALLADGVVLCQLMSGLDQGSIPRIHTGKMLELGFKRRENIMYFIEALRDNKIPPGFIFHVDDLYQHQNFYRVIESLEYLSELAYREWGAPHRKKSKADIRKLVEQGEIELTEEAFARTEKVLKDYLAKKKWFLAPGKTTARVGLPAAAVNSKPTNTDTTATTATPTTTPPPPAEAEDSAPRPRSESEGRSENEGKSADDDDDDKNRKNEAEAEAIMGKNEDEDEDEDEGSTEDGFTKAVSSNPWREAELEEKRRKIEEAERQRREDEDNQREEEQRRLAEAKRREEAAVLTGAIRLQALYRGRLARTAFRSKLRAAAYRENVANEIFQTEKDYVANLGLLFDTFLHPIKEHMTGSVWHYSLASCLANSNSVASGSGLRKSGETPTLVVTNAHTVELKEFKDLFANIQVIRNFNTKLLDDLHPRLRAWTPHQQLGDIFVQVAMFLKVYTAYVKNYDAMRRELAQAKASSPEFKQYLVECADANRGRVGKQDINSLLIQPVQRIPRYLLLLRELAKHTEPDHKDFANINTALEQIKKVAEYIEQKSADSEKVHKMISIQARFHGECESLIDPGRVFIREAQLLGWNVKNKRKQIYVVFLFNDLLVLARPMKENKNWRRTITISSKAKVAASVAAAAAGGAGHHGAGGDAAHSQHQHHQHHQQDLVFSRSFQLRHLVPTALPDTKRGHCFGLVAEFDQAVAKFYTTDPSERDEWLAELHAVKKAIVKNNKARKDVIRRTLRARKNKSVKGLSSMAKAFEADDQQLAGLGIGDDGPGARQHESSAGSQLVLSPRSDPRAGEKPKQQTRREKTMSVMLTPSPPLHHHNHLAGGRAGESSARRESLWEPAVLPTHSSASALPPTGGTSSPSSSSHSVGTAALPRSSSAGTGEPLATVVVGKKGGAAKLRTASSDVIVDDSGSHHHHLKVSNGSRIRKSSKAAARSPLPPPLEEKDSEEWEEVGGGRTGLTDSDSDDDDDHERDADVTTPCDEDEAVPHRRQRASARGGDKTEKTATSLRVVAGGDAAEEEQGDLYGSGGHKPATTTTSGRTRGHVRSRSATFRQRLQLSPRKAFEAISSAKKKAKESGGE